MYRARSFIIILILILSFTGIIQAVDILDLDQIQPGMMGTGKTVFQGTEVEEFPVEIVSILHDTGINEDLILIKAGGDKIEEIGGIAAGMSGSPVYIDGKLIGAIGYGWSNTDQRYALVTPINYMLNLLDELPTTNNKELNGSDENLIKLKTPLLVSGIAGRALASLQEDLAPLDFKVLPGGGLKDQQQDIAAPEPGSAIAVQLARGDVSVASIGTVSYIENNKILAFGHPFTNKGEVDFLLSEAYINAIIPGQERSFKLGSPLNKLLGSINVDRGAGIAGKLEKFSKIVPLKVNVRDKDRNKDITINTQIVNDERYLTALTSNITLQAIDKALDRIGKGSAWVNFKVMGNGLPGLEIESDNMYYSSQDIAARCLSDLYQLLDIVNSNPFKKIDLVNILVEIEVSKTDNVALVQKAEVLNEKIKPGDTLEVEVTLHPYRSKTFTRKISVKLPEDIPPGITTVVIEGGFLGSYGIDTTEQTHEGEEDFQTTTEAQISGYKSFEEMIEEFQKAPDNNDLIIQVYRGYPVAAMEPAIDTPPESGGNVDGVKEDLPAEPVEPAEPGDKPEKITNVPEEKPEIKTVEKTEYVLEGSLTLDINIEDTAVSDKKKEDVTQKTNKLLP